MKWRVSCVEWIIPYIKLFTNYHYYFKARPIDKSLSRKITPTSFDRVIEIAPSCYTMTTTMMMMMMIIIKYDRLRTPIIHFKHSNFVSV